MKSVSYIDIANFNISKFALTEVLPSISQRIERKKRLLRALILNYFEHQPVTICFLNSQGDIFVLECSVIAVTDEHVMLKSGIVIPVKSISSIELI